jgi:hypothetical protein
MKRLIFVLLLSFGAKGQTSILDLIPPDSYYKIELDTPFDTILTTEEVIPILVALPLNYIKTRYTDVAINQIFTIDNFTLWLTFPNCETGAKPFFQIYRTLK